MNRISNKVPVIVITVATLVIVALVVYFFVNKDELTKDRFEIAAENVENSQPDPEIEELRSRLVPYLKYSKDDGNMSVEDLAKTYIDTIYITTSSSDAESFGDYKSFKIYVNLRDSDAIDFLDNVSVHFNGENINYKVSDNLLQISFVAEAGTSGTFYYGSGKYNYYKNYDFVVN
ncbi:MAG: hypothetical protein IJ593_05415 [Lachnospiraceae bacterium]|nr:hypothetical protein [Lachnospiraceae bacterium]